MEERPVGHEADEGRGTGQKGQVGVDALGGDREDPAELIQQLGAVRRHRGPAGG